MVATIVISPLGRQLQNTGEVLRLAIVADDPDITELYDRIEVWRSIDGPGGPYSELTADVVSPARLPLGAADPPASPVIGPSAILSGTTLELVVDKELEVDILFSGSDPITYASAAAQIIAQGLGKVSSYVTALGVLVVETTGTGTGTSLEAKSTDGAVQLGVPIGQLVYGLDARPNLIQGTEVYVFEDLFGSRDYHYKTRFRNSGLNTTSAFSLPQSVGASVGLDLSKLAIGIADLVQGNGKPLINQSVHVHANFNGTLVDGKLMVGTDIDRLTDENGHVEFALVRGQKFAVSVPGTSLFREITVPDRATFNLFDPDIADADTFKIAIPDIIVAERRSL